MARSVSLSTPIPSLDEFGKSLGLSKGRRDFLLKLVHRSANSGQSVTKKHLSSGLVKSQSATGSSQQ